MVAMATIFEVEKFKKSYLPQNSTIIKVLWAPDSYCQGTLAHRVAHDLHELRMSCTCLNIEKTSVGAAVPGRENAIPILALERSWQDLLGAQVSAL